MAMILVPHDEYAWFSVYRVILKLLAFISEDAGDLIAVSEIPSSVKLVRRGYPPLSVKKEPLDNFSKKSLPLSHTIRLRTILVCIEACINAQHWKKKDFYVSDGLFILYSIIRSS